MTVGNGPGPNYGETKMSDKINNGELMTGNAINAKSEALELHELSSEELDAVSGGDAAENARQAQAMKVFSQCLE
jgi:hypothetical protein